MSRTNACVGTFHTSPVPRTGLVWKVPTQALVRDILLNPFYAGAYVWGRRPVETILVDGQLKKRQSAFRRAEDCRVFIRDGVPTLTPAAAPCCSSVCLSLELSWASCAAAPACRAAS